MPDTKEQPEMCPPGGMTTEEYRVRAKEMVDYIADYLDNIRSRRVYPDVLPGFMQQLVPDSAPNRPEPWSRIIADVDRVIMPGMTHWQSPSMHAYFPALNSYPSIIADMLASAINSLAFTWASSPACTELETIVMDWLGKMIGLPPMFLHANKESMGGGCMQTTASDCTFVTLMAARINAIRSYKADHPDLDDSEINGRLIGYSSDQAHSSVEKAGLVGLVKIRLLPSDENWSLRGNTLQEAVNKDRENGLIPFYVLATLGTTGVCAFDNLEEIGHVCRSENLWLHVDAAYAGAAFICPEYRTFMAGTEYSDSFAFSPHKWMMVNYDCAAMWVKDARILQTSFSVKPLYLQHEHSESTIDYMHWHIALSRRFRALKVWFVIRTFGVEGLQAHIRKSIEHASHFEMLVKSDRRFVVPVKRHMGLVLFRIDGPGELTERLLQRLAKQGRVHMVSTTLKGLYVIRFCVTSPFTNREDIDRSWQTIADMATQILAESRSNNQVNILEKDEAEKQGGQMSKTERNGTPNGLHQLAPELFEKLVLDENVKNHNADDDDDDDDGGHDDVDGENEPERE